MAGRDSPDHLGFDLSMGDRLAGGGSADGPASGRVGLGLAARVAGANGARRDRRGLGLPVQRQLPMAPCSWASTRAFFLMPQVPGAFGPTAFAQLRVGAQLGVRL
jgi:hypothetical protein